MKKLILLFLLVPCVSLAQTGAGSGFAQRGGAFSGGTVADATTFSSLVTFNGGATFASGTVTFSVAVSITSQLYVGTVSSAQKASSWMWIGGNAGTDSLFVASNDADATLDSIVYINEAGYLFGSGALRFNTSNLDADSWIEPDVITSGSNTGSFYYDAGNGRVGFSGERASGGAPAVTWTDSSAYWSLVSGQPTLNMKPADGGGGFTLSVNNADDLVLSENMLLNVDNTFIYWGAGATTRIEGDGNGANERIAILVASSQKLSILEASTEIVVNDASSAWSTRIETDNEDSAFVARGSDGHIFMEGPGINFLGATTTLTAGDDDNLTIAADDTLQTDLLKLETGKTVGSKTFDNAGASADTVAATGGTASSLYFVTWTSDPGAPQDWWAEAKTDTLILHVGAAIVGTPSYNWMRLEQ